jgi:class 3 adenylate cyclase/tetratricopeptide (TPR) repeat protein
MFVVLRVADKNRLGHSGTLSLAQYTLEHREFAVCFSADAYRWEEARIVYRPAPIDNSHIRLGSQLTDLIELLARNNHELWAARRITEGWTYGPNRSDESKQTPLLVPYEDVPESAKEYDRDNAIETLKTILALGGTVQAPPPTRPQSEAGANLASLLESWKAIPQQQMTLQQYQETAARANALGECLVACDMADEGLNSWPSDPRLRQIRALALARMGSPERAREILTQLRQEARDDEETLGLLARTLKDLWLKSNDAVDLDNAYRAYAEAYRKSPERYWTGINAATFAFARGDAATASGIAAAVRKVCEEKLVSGSGDDHYWLSATIAEASLILADYEEAERRYAQAISIARNDLGDLASTWRNVRILQRYLPAAVAARIAIVFRMPSVAVFVGHRLDEPDRAPARLTDESASAVGEAIRAKLLELNIRLGFASAAAGSDTLFHEAMMAVGGRTRIVLPCNQAQFIEESVAPWGNSWVNRFHSVLKRADEILIASDERLKVGSVAYEYANNLLHGLAATRADQLETELVHLAVWDGLPSALLASTGDTVRHWRETGRSVHVIDPRHFAPAANVTTGPSARPSSAPPPSINRAVPDFGSEIRAMIFADAFHFSKLSEEQVPAFITDFIGPIAALLAQTRPAPIFQNTWGDGLFFVFEDACDAGQFALNLSDRVAGVDRRSAGLPEGITLRIALHVGPVYQFRDQIIGELNYIGSHVNRTARIEPVTPPGEVYGSYAFVAMAALEAPGRFRCDYVGRIPLAKGFGEFPMYRIQAAPRRAS